MGISEIIDLEGFDKIILKRSSSIIIELSDQKWDFPGLRIKNDICYAEIESKIIDNENNLSNETQTLINQLEGLKTFTSVELSSAEATGLEKVLELEKEYYYRYSFKEAHFKEWFKLKDYQAFYFKVRFEFKRLFRERVFIIDNDTPAKGDFIA